MKYSPMGQSPSMLSHRWQSILMRRIIYREHLTDANDYHQHFHSEYTTLWEGDKLAQNVQCQLSCQWVKSKASHYTNRSITIWEGLLCENDYHLEWLAMWGHMHLQWHTMCKGKHHAMPRMEGCKSNASHYTKGHIQGTLSRGIFRQASLTGG